MNLKNKLMIRAGISLVMTQAALLGGHEAWASREMMERLLQRQGVPPTHASYIAHEAPTELRQNHLSVIRSANQKDTTIGDIIVEDLKKDPKVKIEDIETKIETLDEAKKTGVDLKNKKNTKAAELLKKNNVTIDKDKVEKLASFKTVTTLKDPSDDLVKAVAGKAPDEIDALFAIVKVTKKMDAGVINDAQLLEAALKAKEKGINYNTRTFTDPLLQGTKALMTHGRDPAADPDADQIKAAAGLYRKGVTGVTRTLVTKYHGLGTEEDKKAMAHVWKADSDGSAHLNPTDDAHIAAAKKAIAAKVALTDGKLTPDQIKAADALLKAHVAAVTKVQIEKWVEKIGNAGDQAAVVHLAAAGYADADLTDDNIDIAKKAVTLGLANPDKNQLKATTYAKTGIAANNLNNVTKDHVDAILAFRSVKYKVDSPSDGAITAWIGGADAQTKEAVVALEKFGLTVTDAALQNAAKHAATTLGRALSKAEIESTAALTTAIGANPTQVEIEAHAGAISKPDVMSAIQALRTGLPKSGTTAPIVPVPDATATEIAAWVAAANAGDKAVVVQAAVDRQP